MRRGELAVGGGDAVSFGGTSLGVGLWFAMVGGGGGCVGVWEVLAVEWDTGESIDAGAA